MTQSDPAPYLRQPVTLTNCDTEPIHIPGAIQNHGCLITYRESDFQIVAVSMNVDSFLRISATELLQKDVREIFSQDSPLELNPSVFATQVNPSRTRRFNTILFGKKHAVSRRTSDGLTFLQFEQLDEGTDVESSEMLSLLFRSMDGKTNQETYDVAVREIRQATGFDRVMLYQFHEDEHGSVVAEECHDDMESFLGLHYPAGDIPLPARRLYARNWIRTISDVSAEPSALLSVPNEPRVHPLDLSDCELRAVSPIHIEYLQNMKVGATMSISILDGERLWGLIVCHHNSARHVKPQERDACELAGSTLSAYLTSRRQQDYLRAKMDVSERLPSQLAFVAGPGEMSHGLSNAVPMILELMDADGMAWIDRHHTKTWEVTPDSHTLERIVQQLRKNHGGDLAYTDQLAGWLDSSDKVTLNCAGMIALFLGRTVENGVLLILRSPLVQKIDWAGNPDKSVVDEGGRLTPRKSFKKYQEEIADRSRPWSDNEKNMARSILATLKTLVVERAAMLQQANEELRQLNTDLDAFAYAASHDLKEPLRGIKYYTRLLESGRTLGDEAYQSGLVGLNSIVERMDHLLDGLLRFSRVGRSELDITEFELETAVQETIDSVLPQTDDPNIVITVDPNGTLKGDVSCVKEILGNLLTNAIKYNDSKVRTVCVGVVPTSQTGIGTEFGRNAVFVRDNGIGIPSKYYDEVFDVFRRLHGPHEYGGGSGAGLTIVRRMVERHGGRIAVNSTPEGTTFAFTLGEHE